MAKNTTAYKIIHVMQYLDSDEVITLQESYYFNLTDARRALNDAWNAIENNYQYDDYNDFIEDAFMTKIEIE